MPNTRANICCFGAAGFVVWFERKRTADSTRCILHWQHDQRPAWLKTCIIFITSCCIPNWYKWKAKLASRKGKSTKGSWQLVVDWISPCCRRHMNHLHTLVRMTEVYWKSCLTRIIGRFWELFMYCNRRHMPIMFWQWVHWFGGLGCRICWKETSPF